MKGWLYLIAFVAICFRATGQEDLLCFNVRCFEPEEVEPTVVLKDSAVIEREINEDFIDMIAAMNQGLVEPLDEIQPQEAESIEDYLFQDSKYFQRQGNLPLPYRSYLYVPSRDMIWANHPEYESTRPKVQFNLYRPPCPPPDIFDAYPDYQDRAAYYYSE